MKVVFDIEANGLHNPTKIWVIVAKDIVTGERYIFRNLLDEPEDFRRFQDWARNVTCWIGHNVLGYDIPVLNNLLGNTISYSPTKVIDTLVCSKLIDYSREGHSIEDYGLEFGQEKITFNDYSKYSPELEARCITDVDICEKIYLKYKKYLNNPERQRSIILEHSFQWFVVNALERNGFSFNVSRANKLLEKVNQELKQLDEAILNEFPPREVLIREFSPRQTKYGTISKTSVPRSWHNRIHELKVGEVYRDTKFVAFNPSSHKQIIQVLNEAGWSPTDRTQTYILTEREIRKLKRELDPLDPTLQSAILKLEKMEKTAWKVNEQNLSTLPPSAPSPARTLAKRILLEARRRSLTEWLSLVNPQTERIHGKFYGIGAWTHRMAHQNPNTANIPTDAKLYGKEMRSLWRAPKNRLLVGVDAEGIQLRIFAHYIDDPDFTKALVEGKKDDKTDPHSLNQRILGSVCKSRQIAKRFIFAYLLGAGVGKLSEILECSKPEGEAALDRMLARYAGLQELRKEIIPADAKRGWFVGLDGRAVKIPSDEVGYRRHLAMSGYLQNGEAVVMKMAAVKWTPAVTKLDGMLVGMIHDEWQTECPNNMEIALEIAKIQANSLKEVGEELKLKCPLAGSYWSEDHKDYSIGVNWWQTH